MIAAERAEFRMQNVPLECEYSVVIAKIGNFYSKHVVRFAPAAAAQLAEMSDDEIVAATAKKRLVKSDQRIRPSGGHRPTASRGAHAA